MKIIKECPPVRSERKRNKDKNRVETVGNNEVYDFDLLKKLRALGFFVRTVWK